MVQSLKGKVAISYSVWMRGGRKQNSWPKRQVKKAESYCQKVGMVLDMSVHNGSEHTRVSNETKTLLAELIAFVRARQTPCDHVLIVETLGYISEVELADTMSSFFELLNIGMRIVTLGDGKVHDAQFVREDHELLCASLNAMQAGSRGTKNMSAKLSASWVERVQELASGKHIPISKVPFWIDQATQQFNNRVSDVRAIFALAGEGHGATSLMRLLNERGIKSPSGGTWGRRVVQDLLHSKATYGTLVIKGVEIHNYYPAVMSKVDWLALRGSRPKPRTHLEHWTHVNLFPRLLRCGNCGSPMIVTSRRIRERDYVYATCEGRRGARTTCDARNWPYAAFEEAFLSQLEALLTGQISSLLNWNRPIASSALSLGLRDIGNKPQIGDLELAVAEDRSAEKDCVIATPVGEDAVMRGVDLHRMRVEDRPRLRILISTTVERVDLQPYEPDHISAATVFLKNAAEFSVFVESAKSRHTTANARRM